MSEPLQPPVKKTPKILNALGNDIDRVFKAILDRYYIHKFTQVFGSHALGQTLGAGLTSYLSIFGTGFLSSLSSNPINNNGTIKNLRVRTGTTQTATGTAVVTIMINAVASALMVTIPAGGIAGTYSDLTHTVAFTAGQSVRIDVTNNGSVASATFGLVTFDLEQSV